MREFKYRCWDKVNNQMFIVERLYFDKKGNATHVGIDIEALNDDETFQVVDIKHVELLEFTGLKDKNGVEVYESDILKNDDEEFAVVYDNEDACFTLQDDNVITNFQVENPAWYEVVGNIYQEEYKHLRGDKQ